MKMRRFVLGAVAIAAVLAGAGHILTRGGAGLGDAAGAATSAAPPPAMPVPVTKVVKRTIPIHLDYSARTEAIRNVTLQAKVSGYLEEQRAPDGADVRQGDLLYRIDDRDFRAAIDQASAQVERDAASLDYLRANRDRGDKLAKSGYLAQDSFDQRASAVRQTEAAVAMGEAAIRTAQLNLDHTEIRAPFPGRIGRNQAPVGTLVSAAGTALNTLVQLDPIYVTFNPSETDLAEIQKARAAGKVEAEVLVPGETEPRHKGELTFVDNVVDPGTGTITARATIDNRDFALLPGQYVRIRLHVRDEADMLMIPQTALGASQLGKYVYVVGADNKADLRLVSLGPASGQLVAVRTGVAEGDRVIDGNLQKIGPGAQVQPMPQAAAPTL